jgi:hypothetical protein
MRWRRLFELAVALAFVCGPAVPVMAQQTFYCETDCGGSTDCSYQCINGGSVTTCVEYLNGGYGACAGSCGDRNCNSGETQDSCPSDCSPPQEFLDMRWPNDGIPWSSRTSNLASADPVGGCFGNCGAGCSMVVHPFGDLALCGTPPQYWELTYSGLSSWTSFDCRCVDNDSTHLCGETTHYSSPSATWTYYGWHSSSCQVHDWTCRTSWQWAAATLVSHAIFGWLGAPWWTYLFAVPTNCVGTSFWGAGGSSNYCPDAGPAQWSYGTSIYTDTFEGQYYWTGDPGSCYSGPPACGDGVCQTNNCDASTPTPGNGCEELGGFNASPCWADCS